MKTKELIELLQKKDPSGETEIMIGNRGITDITLDPMYYDGLGILPIFDEQNEVVGIKFRSEGLKINIWAFDLKEVFLHNEEPVIDSTELPESYKERWMEKLERLKADGTAKREEYRKTFYRDERVYK